MQILELLLGEKRHKNPQRIARNKIQENMYKRLSVFKISRSWFDEIYTNVCRITEIITMKKFVHWGKNEHIKNMKLIYVHLFMWWGEKTLAKKCEYIYFL